MDWTRYDRGKEVKFVLVAHNEHKELVQLHRQFSREELQLLRQQQQFFCPQCQEPLQLKIGQIRIPHFSHFQQSECEALFSERESQTHLLGKQHLYELFERLALSPRLEPYLPHIKQRPDLLFEYENRQFAIEFQYSNLQQEIFLERTVGYLSANITPIWIPHTQLNKKSVLGIQKVSLNHTLAQYMLQNNGQRYLLTYDVASKKFYYFSNLLHLHKTQYLASIKSIPLAHQRFPLLIPTKISRTKFEFLFTKLLYFRESYLHPRLLLSKRGVNDSFLRAIYELKLTTANLPIFLGIPVKNTNAFADYCIEWQVQLFYFLKCHALTPQTMNTNAIAYFLQWANIARTIERTEEVAYYLRLLKQLNIQHVHEKIEKKQLIDVLYGELVAIG